MKKLFFLLFFSLLTAILNAQVKTGAQMLGDKAKAYFDNEQYFMAKQYYERAVEEDSNYVEGIYQLANCHRFLFEFDQAAKQYRSVILKERMLHPKAWYYLPLMLKLSGSYEESIAEFDRFLQYTIKIPITEWPEKSPWVEQALIEKEGAIFALQQDLFEGEHKQLELLPFPVNTEFNDYGAMVFQNDETIVFTSGRMGTEGSIFDNRYGEAFTDNLRFIQKNKSWKFDKRNDHFEITNSKWNDGAGVFSADYSYYYFTRCGNDDNENCQLWYTRLEEGNWQAPIAMDGINLQDYESKQPAINATQDTLYFVSDRPGGYGQNDIWYSAKNQSGEWEPAVNMGSTVNTAYNEVSPYVHPGSNRLFFSSDGHQTMGGLDVFMVERQYAFEDLTIINLGKPVNSAADDCYFTVGSDFGYVSSNRPGGKGKFDIYRFDNQNFSRYLNNDIFKSGRKWVIETKLNASYFSELYAMREEDELFYENIQANDQIVFDIALGRRIENTKDDESAENDYIADLPSEYRKSIEMMQGRPNDVSTGSSSTPQNTLVEIPKLPRNQQEVQVVRGKLIENSSQLPIAGETIQLVDGKGKVIYTVTTNKDGSFEFSPITEEFAPYRILVVNNQENKLNQMSVKDLSSFSLNIDKEVVPVLPVYFHLDQFNIAEFNFPSLEELANYLISHPDSEVNLYAYADSLGSSRYNLGLSKRRGESLSRYLVGKGVGRQQLSVVEKGENDQKMVMPNEIFLQHSRKVVAVIASEKSSFKSGYTIWLLRDRMSLAELTELLSMELNQLKTLNSVKGNFLEESSLITLPADIEVISEKLFKLSDLPHQ